MSMYLRLAILFISFFNFSLLPAQTVQTYYDIHWKTCPKEESSFISIVEKTDSGYYRKDYFTNSGKLQMTALYEDEKTEIMNGHAFWYFANGQLQKKARYLHGELEGLFIELYPNGFLLDSSWYQNGQIAATSFRWHSNGFLKDSIAPIGDSNFVSVSWFDNGQPAAAGRTHGDKPYGSWTYYDKNGSKTAVVQYENGNAVSKQFYDLKGTPAPYKQERWETPADLKGGVKTWLSYLQKKLVWPEPYHFKDMKKVVMAVELTIDENGNITEVYVRNPFHPAFDNLAYNIISNGPKWTPAVQYNRNVKYRFLQPITFQDL